MPEVKYKLTVEGAVESRSAIEHVNESAGEHGLGGTLKEVGSETRKLGRDFAALGDTGAGHFAHLAHGALGVIEAIGAGGIAGAVSAAVVIGGTFFEMYKEGEEEIKKKAEELKKAMEEQEKAFEKSVQNILKSRTVLSESDAKEHEARRDAAVKEEEANSKRLDRLSLFAAANEDEIKQLRTRNKELEKVAAEEQEKHNAAMEQLASEVELQERLQEAMLSGENEKKKSDETKKKVEREIRALNLLDETMNRFLAEESAARKKAIEDDIRAEEVAAKDRFKLEMRSNEEYINAVKDNAAQVAEIKNEQQKTNEVREASALAKEEARIGRALYSQRIALVAKNQAEEEALEKKKYFAAEDEKIEKLMNMGVSPEEIAAIKARDDELAKAKIDNRKAVADATIENLQREREAEEKARVMNIALSQAETARAAAVMIAQPVFNEMLNSEKELLSVNRDTFQDYKNQDWGAIIAAKTQAILAGIAVEATAKTVMEGGEALASFGAALGFAAIGDIPSATAAAGAGAQHLAAAAVFGSIAGVTAGGAIGVGAMRGDGGLFASGEKKKEDKASMTGGSGSSGARGGSISGKGNGDNGETQVTMVFMPGAFLADSRTGIATVNSMVAAGQRDPFMQRQNARSP